MNAPIPLPLLRVSYNYVLILEWLEDSDERRGSSCMTTFSQYRCLRSWWFAIARMISLTPWPTRCAAFVLWACPWCISNLMEATRRTGHFRSVIWNLAVPGLSWRDLGDWLAPLNEACDFGTLVVGATCFGFASIAAMKLHEHVAPFAGCVGFTTSVYPGSLSDAMKELYRSFKSGSDLTSSVENANRELRGSNECLRATSATMLAYQISRGVYDRVRTPNAIDGWVQSMFAKLRDAGFAVPPLVERAMPAKLHQLSREHIQRAWDGWFPHALQERDCGYRLDWTFVEMAVPE